MPNGPPRRGPPASAASFGYEPFPGQGDPYDPYRRMPQPGAAGERYSSGSMPRGPRPQVSLWSENDFSQLLLIWSCHGLTFLCRLLTMELFIYDIMYIGVCVCVWFV